jgi:hypothetical protein
MYFDLSLDYVFNDWFYYYNLYGVEYGYLFLVGNIAPFVRFEYFQAFVTLIFIYSTIRLARSVGHNNPAFALSVCLTFLLLTLVFSTIRQCLAISLFNIGVVVYYGNYFSRLVKLCLVSTLFLVSVLFQSSALIYCVTFVYCNLRLTQNAKNLSLLLLGLLTTSAMINPEIINGFIDARAVAKLQFYSELNLGLINPINAFYLALFSFIFVGLLRFLPKAQISKFDRLDKFAGFARALLVLNVVCIPFPIFRDRISYEVFIVTSILFSHQTARLKLIFPTGLVVLGIFSSFFGTLYQYTGVVFIPYQNYLIYSALDIPSDGRRRQAEFFEQFNQRLKSFQ